jgi:hypothetical protein
MRPTRGWRPEHSEHKEAPAMLMLITQEEIGIPAGCAQLAEELLPQQAHRYRRETPCPLSSPEHQVTSAGWSSINSSAPERMMDVPLTFEAGEALGRVVLNLDGNDRLLAAHTRDPCYTTALRSRGPCARCGQIRCPDRPD